MSRRFRIGLAMAGLAALAPWMLYLAVHQVDDAYIVYRYAENLAHGKGFVYNEGERVEGVSCFLWVVALVPFAAAGLSLPVAAPILTALAGAALVFLLPGTVAHIERRPGADAWDMAAPVLLAVHPTFAYWSVGALETAPFALLILLALRAHAAEAEGGGLGSAAWMGLASLVRPEAPVLGAALALDRAIRGRARGGAALIRDTAIWCATVAAVFVPFLVWRRLYFGEWLPNTYYAKSGAGLAATVQSGLRYTRGFLGSLAGFGSTGAWAWLPGSALAIALLGFGLARPRLRAAALLVLAAIVAVLFEGGDWMILHRFFMPVLAPLVLLAVAAGRALAGRGGFVPRAACAAVGLLWLASGVAYAVRERNRPEGLLWRENGYRIAHRVVADFLRARSRPGDTVALMDIGIIGHETGLGVIDISGLTDREVAHSPGGFLRKNYPPERVLDRRPRWVVLVPGFPIDTRIVRAPALRDGYRLVLTKEFHREPVPSGPYSLYVYQRADR